VVSRIEIDYMVPLHADETMVSKLWIERRGPRFVFHQDIFHQDGSPVVKAIVTAVAIENGRPSRGDALAQLFAKFL
jgi:acyl-CoA thioesterase FadM